MAAETNIEWCDATFNPWIGCTKVSPGCDHCYAERSTPARTMGIQWAPTAARHRTAPSNWAQVKRWNDAHDAFHAQHGRRRRVFCASLADVFDNQVPYTWREDLWKLIADTPNLDWLILTKRIGIVAGWVALFRWPANAWLGITVVNQAEADRDIPKLLEIPAPVRFLSMEPLLGPVSLRWLAAFPESAPHHAEKPGGYTDHLDGLRRLDWVIAGGESGPKARPSHPDWYRSLRDQCAEAGVPFLFKQWGEHSLDFDRDRDDPDYRRCDTIARKPGRWINLAGGHGFNGERVHYAHKVAKKAAGRLLDGVEHNGFPTVGELR